jgi:ribosomal protein S12 methylthiotransferase
VEGAKANDLPGALPAEVREERKARFMKAQEKISADRLKKKIGKTCQVLVDEPGLGRSAADAPEIDGVVHFKGGKAGEFVKVSIDRVDAHDLYGRLQ